jgi:hypothetical protein
VLPLCHTARPPRTLLGSSIRWAAFGPVFVWACSLSLSGPISSCCIVTICTEVTRMAGYRLSFVSTDIPVHLLLYATCSVSPPRFPCCSSIPCSSSSNSFPCCYFSFPTTMLLTIGIRDNDPGCEIVDLSLLHSFPIDSVLRVDW